MAEPPKLNEFAPPSLDAWRKLVERDLRGVPFADKLVKRVAGVEVRPLYTRADTSDDAAGLPGVAPYTRGATLLGAVADGWDLCFELAHGDLEAGTASVRRNVAGGVRSIALRLDRATRAGNNEHGLEGIAVECLDELAALLGDAPLDAMPVVLDAGASALPLAAGLVALARHRNIALDALRGSFGIDPLGTLATFGSLPSALDVALADAAEVAQWVHAEAPHVTALVVDTACYHEAGADASFEVALALATGLEYLRALTRAGLEVDQAARQVSFRFSIGRDFFAEVAKLRAARRTWARVVEASGGSTDAQRMRIHASTSRRTKAQRDPWVNLLRATAESFAAVVGGADVITTHGFDATLGDSDGLAERMARNTQHLLRHESNLHRVIDPAGGSFYVESLTDALAQRAWERLQAIERSGGLARAVLEGSIQQELQGLLETERKAVEKRKLPITGVSEFAFADEPKVLRTRAASEAVRARAERAAERSSVGLARLSTESGARFRSAIDAASKGAAFGALRVALCSGEPARCRPLVRERLAEPFEVLRDRADALADEHGERPRVFFANLGPIADHKARAGFAQGFLEAGGFHALTNDGFADAEAAADAFAKSGAQHAALCASDAVYATLAEPTARALRERGARAIVLAGAPGEREAAYREAGVTDFIHLGVNAVESLRSLLERTGAQS
ncbi:MAG: methylmalonyl-CoA mutase family protein [Polyangiales bacterium]